MLLQIYTIIHVIISLLAIASGFVVIRAWLRGLRPAPWTHFFLATTLATSVTGFFFPFKGFTPALGFGIVSVLLLTATYLTLKPFHATGRWRKTCLLTALVAQYLNTFVLVVQSFQKIPFLRTFAPTQSEPPFAAAQLSLLALFVWFGIALVKRGGAGH